MSGWSPGGPAPVSRAARWLATTLLLLCAAAPVHAADKKLPKRPDRPMVVAIMAVPPPASARSGDPAKSQKDVEDSIADIKANLEGKRKEWFTLVDDPAQAEIILEIQGRGTEAGHGAVIRGQVRVFQLDPITILGQGGLNPNGLDPRYWRQAASDMAGRLQKFLQATYETIEKARKNGVRPLAVAANDRGVDQMKAHDLTAAIASFDEAIRLAPTYALPLFNRGLALSSRKEWPAASQSFDAAIRLDATNGKAFFYRANARREGGDLAGARSDLDEAVRLDPRDGEARIDRGSVLSQLGEHKAALADFEQVAAVAPKLKGRALARQGAVLEKLGDKAGALAAYDAAVAAGFEEAALHYNRGRLLAAKGDAAASCAAFGSAAALDAKDPDMLFERGTCRANKGLLDQAVVDFSEAVRLKPDMAIAWFNRGICYSRQGKTALARADRARALKLDPGLAAKK
jgi:tetratricopeptide (TPR) repeat protein